MKIVSYIILFIAFILVTFFGLGPILLADGSTSERIITLLVVLVIYFLLGWITVRLIKHSGGNRK